MDKKDKFVAQEAPDKNTDQAFVRVGEDGKPELPREDNNAPAEGSGTDETDGFEDE